MPAPTLTKPQSGIDNILFDIVDAQRTFDSNNGNRGAEIHRDIMFGLTVATAAGLVVGGLVGAVLGMRRS